MKRCAAVMLCASALVSAQPSLVIESSSGSPHTVPLTTLTDITFSNESMVVQATAPLKLSCGQITSMYFDFSAPSTAVLPQAAAALGPVARAGISQSIKNGRLVFAINGLKRPGASLKIFSVDGRFIRALTVAADNTAVWDYAGQNGATTGTGCFVAVAEGKDERVAGQFFLIR